MPGLQQRRDQLEVTQCGHERITFGKIGPSYRVPGSLRLVTRPQCLSFVGTLLVLAVTGPDWHCHLQASSPTEQSKWRGNCGDTAAERVWKDHASAWSTIETHKERACDTDMLIFFSRTCWRPLGMLHMLQRWTPSVRFDSGPSAFTRP